MSSKTNNWASTHPIKHSLRTHPSTQSTVSVSGSGVLDCTTLPIVVSLDPRALSSILERPHLLQQLRGRDCLSPRPDRGVIVQLGALHGDVISRCHGIRASSWKLTSQQLRNATGGKDGDDKRAFWSRKSKEYRMSGDLEMITQWQLPLSCLSFSPPMMPVLLHE